MSWEPEEDEVEESREGAYEDESEVLHITPMKTWLKQSRRHLSPASRRLLGRMQADGHGSGQPDEDRPGSALLHQARQAAHTAVSSEMSEDTAHSAEEAACARGMQIRLPACSVLLAIAGDQHDDGDSATGGSLTGFVTVTREPIALSGAGDTGKSLAPIGWRVVLRRFVPAASDGTGAGGGARGNTQLDTLQCVAAGVIPINWDSAGQIPPSGFVTESQEGCFGAASHSLRLPWGWDGHGAGHTHIKGIPSPRLLRVGVAAWPALGLVSGLLPIADCSTAVGEGSGVEAAHLAVLVPGSDQQGGSDKHMRPGAPSVVSLHATFVGTSISISTNKGARSQGSRPVGAHLVAAGEAAVGSCVGFRSMAVETPPMHARMLRPPRPQIEDDTKAGGEAAAASTGMTVQEAGMLVSAQFVKGTEQLRSLLSGPGSPAPSQEEQYDKPADGSDGTHQEPATVTLEAITASA